ncbi:MAG: hypothetical protein A4E28_00923 [Methanocella sp. PtaU1.Bin125]|nr:MAG: hypothetical protein A4E28_00923 [Methanocella sp. PtaU1.Bin125]
MDGTMQKEELLYIHSVLAQVKRHIEAGCPDADFSGYEALRISPAHVHRSKNDHKRAIYVLGEEITRATGHSIVPAGKRIEISGIREKALAGLKA